MADVDKRSMSTDALATLGTIISPKEGRDAIHLAVEPMEAGEEMYSGGDVYIGKDGKGYLALIEQCPKPVGIVDPFLTTSIKPGEWFWLVVYPRTITSLRHVWEHPAIPRRLNWPPAKKMQSAG